jgi:peptide/bleomycin uptake transporter
MQSVHIKKAKMMFEFFRDKKWWRWSILGSALILFFSWLQVYIDVQLNAWIGTFYDTLQVAMSKPNTVTTEEFMTPMLTFAGLAGMWVVISSVNNFFVSHWVFRWRTSMATRYHAYWKYAKDVEGASQRVQEDTLKFARFMETLGTGLVDSILTLIAFVPILWTLSMQVTELPWIGEVSHSLVWVALLSALGGTMLLVIIGWKLPGIEYNIQKQEAGYRKELVMGESSDEFVKPDTINELFGKVRQIHYRSYFHYFYFNLSKWSYFQGMVLVPYVALSPTIVAGAVTLGFVQQIVRAFNRVESSLQYLVRSWSTIVEFISVWKRLHEFETKVQESVK